MKIAVIGSGSWGTALSKVLVENGHEVTIWGLEEDVVDEINHHHTNKAYLPDIDLPNELVATNDFVSAVANKEIILLVVPTNAMRSVATKLKKQLENSEQSPIIVHAGKGLELNTHLRISEVLEECLDDNSYKALVVLSGPSHAEEVAKKDITTVAAASKSLEAAKKVQDIFMNSYFRVYTNQDVIGVELGGALKNIIALAAGMCDGLGYGINSKAALVTRGLAEITRLGVSMGADPLTFSGLSGVGDLIVTCMSPHSRNWQAGMLFAKGYDKEHVNSEIKMVVEGITTCLAAYELAQERYIEMPITQSLYQLIYGDTDIQSGLNQLMSRTGKQEASST